MTRVFDSYLDRLAETLTDETGQAIIKRASVSGHTWDELATIAEHFYNDLVPEMTNSPVVLAWAGDHDPFGAMQLGMAIKLGKPIIMLLVHGKRINARERAVADVVITMHQEDLDDRVRHEALHKRIAAEIRRLGGNRAT